MEKRSNLVPKLLEKSKEAFMMAIEIYNKPSIRYRVEGFSFFICNAWELMLKAHIINTYGESAIYYKDNPNRTITLELCLKLVFTNEHAPIRKNLMRIVELRNTSTHFIVEEYEMLYIPLFQACIFNFNDKMMEYHNVDMTMFIPQNFLTLTVSMRALNEAEIRSKYPAQLAERLLSVSQSLKSDIDENNDSFAIKIEHHHYITKDRNKATDIVHIESTAKTGIQIVKEVKDPNDTFKFTAKRCIKEIGNRLIRNHIDLKYNGEIVKFNMYHFCLFTKYYMMKDNDKLCYIYRINNPPTYSYSIQAIDFIVDEIKKDPENIIQNLKSKLSKKEANPRSLGILSDTTYSHSGTQLLSFTS